MSTVPFPSSVFHQPTGFILGYKGRDITLSSPFIVFLPPYSPKSFLLFPSVFLSLLPVLFIILYPPVPRLPISLLWRCVTSLPP